MFDDGEQPNELNCLSGLGEEGKCVRKRDLHSFLMKIAGPDNGLGSELGGLH